MTSNENRPAGNEAASAVRSLTDSLNLPITAIKDEVAIDRARGALCVIVRTADARYRRRLFLTLASAERARDRALQAGHAASIVLCDLVPHTVLVDDEEGVQ